MNTKKKIPKIFYSKLFLAIILIALAVTITIEYRKWQERRAVDLEIAELQKEEQELSEQNRKLEESIEFLSSEQYQEKLARLQLNLQKQDELVINLPTQIDPSPIINQESNTPNYIKWWEYIFLN